MKRSGGTLKAAITNWALKIDMAERDRQTMFHTRSRPKLQGKAGEVKDLGPVMVMVWEKHMNHNLLIHQKILVVLKGFSCLCIVVLLSWGG